MRRVRTGTPREAYRILAVLAHSTIIATVWNVISETGGHMTLMAPWEPLGTMLIIGMIASKPVRGHWTDRAVRIVHFYMVMFCIIIANYIMYRII